MSTIDTSALGDRLRPRRGTLLWGALVLNTELVLLLAYALFGSQTLNSGFGLRMWIYPFVWINASLYVLLRMDPPPGSNRNRRIAAALAVGYFGILAVAGGLVGHAHGPSTARIAWALPPGWSPAFIYTGSVLTLNLILYKVIGYVTLAYLVYATVLDAAGSAVTGVLGLLSCVSCSWPVIAAIATGIAGSSSGIAAAVTDGSYGISTVVFVVTVALLYWRPFGRE